MLQARGVGGKRSQQGHSFHPEFRVWGPAAYPSTEGPCAAPPTLALPLPCPVLAAAGPAFQPGCSEQTRAVTGCRDPLPPVGSRPGQPRPTSRSAVTMASHTLGDHVPNSPLHRPATRLGTPTELSPCRPCFLREAAPPASSCSLASPWRPREPPPKVIPARRAVPGPHCSPPAAPVSFPDQGLCCPPTPCCTIACSHLSEG